jgi:BCD family chlorophyll transporter-like MFS transporter
MLGSLKGWTVAGCLGSAVALASLVVGGTVGPEWPIRASVAALGFANGVYAVAAIGSMMGFAASGGEGREGTRMGLWGAAQAVAFGIGGFMGAAAVDITRQIVGTPAIAYGTVFAAEALLFVLSAVLAARVTVARPPAARAAPATPSFNLVTEH